MNKATMAFGTGLLFVLIALTSACSSGEPGPVPMNLEIVGPLALELGISEEQVMDAMADASMEGGMTVWDMRREADKRGGIRVSAECGSMLDGYPVWVGRPPEPELDAREVAEAVARVGGEDAVAQVLVKRPKATTDGLVAWIRARIERDQGGAPRESDVECLELIEELAG